MGRFDIRTRSGLLSTIVQGQTASPSDGDAQAFIFRVEAAGGTLTTTEKNSINTLVIRLKAANIWTKLLAVYPMVGASGAACAQNLKSTSFSGSFFGGWTFASTGVTGNGTTGYMNTGLNLSTATPIYNVHFSLYVRNDTNIGIDIGATTSNAYSNEGLMSVRDTGNIQVGFYNGYQGPGKIEAANTNSQGFYVASALASNNLFVAKNSVVQGVWITANTSIPANGNTYIGAINDVSNNNAYNYTTREYAFASIGNGLTTTEASDFYTIVQEYQTLLGRQIGAPAVSDADASAFIQRVYTAGGTLTTAEQNAVNQLTIDLKAASVWTSMKAVYPMVGSSAAACAQNLRTGSFTGTFAGGVTYAATGITGNGTTGYMSTALTPSVTLTNANHHISFYSRTNAVAGNSVEIGTYEPGFGFAGPALRAKNASNQIQYLMGTATAYFDTTSSNADSRGLFIGNILSISNRKTYKNGSVSGTNTGTSTAFSGTGPIYVLAVNGYPSTPGAYSIKELAFASIGDGLTDTQAVYLNNAVETFQTSLSRNVGATIPTVSDADATDFIARVYGAGGTLSTLECNAVNQLAISMKATGVWNSTKAVYPMVGASAAACAQNLKSTSYTGTFSGGWAYSSNGITGNGTNTYMNTTLVPNTQLSQNSAHLAGYLRTTNSANHALLGSYLTYVLNYGYAQIHGAGDNAAVNTAGQTGFFLNSRIMATQIKQYKNNSILGTYTTNSSTPTVDPIYVGALSNGVNPANNYVNGQIAFASIGDGLTDQQESDYYSAVQAFQTTLNRNV